MARSARGSADTLITEVGWRSAADAGPACVLGQIAIVENSFSIIEETTHTFSSQHRPVFLHDHTQNSFNETRVSLLSLTLVLCLTSNILTKLFLHQL